MLFLRSLHICDGYFYSLHSLFGSVPYIFFRILTRAPHENCFFRSLFISINSSAIFWDHGFPASSVFFLKYLNRWTLHSPCPVPKWYNAVSWSWIRVPVYFLKKSISPNSLRVFPFIALYITVSFTLKLRILACLPFILTVVPSVAAAPGPTYGFPGGKYFPQTPLKACSRIHRYFPLTVSDVLHWQHLKMLQSDHLT